MIKRAPITAPSAVAVEGTALEQLQKKFELWIDLSKKYNLGIEELNKARVRIIERLGDHLVYTMNEFNASTDGITMFVEKSFSVLIDIYLVSSALYYLHDRPILNDGVFDLLCKYLLENFDDASSEDVHNHQFLHRDALEAGTGLGVDIPHELKLICAYIIEDLDKPAAKIVPRAKFKLKPPPKRR